MRTQPGPWSRGSAQCRSGGSRELGGAASDVVAGDRRRFRACRRSYMKRRGLGGCRRAPAHADAPGPCRRGSAQCRSGGSRELGGAPGNAVAGDRRRFRACRRSYVKRHGLGWDVGAPAAAKTAVPKSARDEIGLVRASFRHPGASVDFFYTVSTQPARITCTPTKNQRLKKQAPILLQ